MGWAVAYVLFVMLLMSSVPEREYVPPPVEFHDDPDTEVCLDAHMTGSKWTRSARVTMGEPNGVYMRDDTNFPGVLFHKCIDGTYERTLVTLEPAR